MGTTHIRWPFLASCLLGLALAIPSATPAPAAMSGTVTWAELPHQEPDYIFPFMPLTYDTAWNANEFQYLMYRPLYWFGQSGGPGLNRRLSLAAPPQFSSTMTSVTIQLKSWQWSDGEELSSQDVLFWMNLLHAEKTNWGGYVPNGNDIPDNVKSVTVDSPTEITFGLARPVSAQWFTDNQLSQITPLPIAWDKTTLRGAPGSGGCSSASYGTGDAACTTVYNFLSVEAGDDPSNPILGGQMLFHYGTNPLWQVVDGPWRLSTFDPYGRVTMVPNRTYSGSPKPTISRFVEVPFSGVGGEYTTLQSGALGVGYLRTSDVDNATQNPRKAGPNNVAFGDYQLVPQYLWQIDYFPYNFDSEGDDGAAGPIFRQLYVRQALQLLVDQPALIASVAHGYGSPTTGPVPLEPPNGYVTSAERSNPYPYGPARARALLRSHGWQLARAGSVCLRPGTAAHDCGAGILAGARLRFDLEYAASAPLLGASMRAERASWASAGIDVVLHAASFETVVNDSSPCPNGCAWELENPGVGWEFSPEVYPSGEDIFATGSLANFGDYSDPTTDADIAASESSPAALTEYEDYVAQQLPVVFQPVYANQLVEVRNGLSGVTPLNVFGSLTPENWRL